ncbi:hypothetical protein ACFWOL_35190, partial [Streptomyces sp. NPDC058442]|uniref:hypothetical protein n=1 Tax=Streptomyces sp. NPDC058442 TaxID=3346503 RepID=UPI00366638A1
RRIRSQLLHRTHETPGHNRNLRSLPNPGRFRLLLFDVADLSEKQEAKYNARFADLAALARNDRVADERLRELATQDEPLAAYLYALRVSGLLRNAPTPPGVRAALAHLKSHDAAMNDRRCLRLLVDLFWLAKTGHRFMGGERLTLPLTREDWIECRDLADRLKAADELSLLRVEFMRALAFFHLGLVNAAYGAFRTAEQQSLTFRRRVVSMYMASDSSGSPLTTLGEIPAGLVGCDMRRAVRVR